MGILQAAEAPGVKGRFFFVTLGIEFMLSRRSGALEKGFGSEEA